MTEAEWLTCSEPKSMLDFLREKASDRKLRLLGTGICRHFQGQTKIEAVASALESSERYADTMRTKAALKRGRHEVKAIRHGIPNHDKSRIAEWVTLWLAEVAASVNAYGGVGGEVIRLASSGFIAPETPASMVNLMRCVFGTSLFRPACVDVAQVTPEVVSLARLIYDQRAFDRLPELADALQNAGCSNSEFLEHCRASSPHVRGCWVVDLVLEKT